MRVAVVLGVGWRMMTRPDSRRIRMQLLPAHVPMREAAASVGICAGFRAEPSPAASQQQMRSSLHS